MEHEPDRAEPPPEDAGQLPGLDPANLLRFGGIGAVLAVIASGTILAGTIAPGTWRSLAAARWQAAPLVATLVLGWWLCHAARILILARTLGYPVGFRQAVVIALATQLGTAATPSSVGSPILRVTFSRRAGVPVGPAIAMMMLDYTLDLVFFAALAPLAVWVLWHAPGWRRVLATFELPDLPLVVGAIAIAALAVAASLWIVRRRAAEWNALVRFRRVLALGRRTRAARDAGHELLTRHRAVVLLDFALAAAQWTCRYSTLPVILWALGHPVHAIPLIFIQALLYAGSTAMIAPGGGGGVEAAAAFVLGQIVPGDLVGVVVLAWRLATYYSLLAAGGAVVLAALVRHRRSG